MARTAPKLAHWWKAAGARLPAQTRAVGPTGNGQPVMVEMLIDGIWTDMSSLGLVLSDNQVAINQRGRPGEQSVSGPATCSFELKNFDSRFSVNDPTSPYWGKVVLGTRVRISVPSGNGVSFRFYGELSSVPQESDITGQYSTVDFEASGILRRLSQGEKPVHSAMYRDYTSGIPMDAGNAGGLLPVAYWPMEDVPGSTSLASPIAGVKPMTFTGAPDLATYSGFPGTDPIPNMNGCSFSAQFPAPVPSSDIGSDSYTIEFIMSAPGGLTNGMTIAQWTTGGEAAVVWRLSYPSTDHLQLRVYDLDNNLLVDSGSTAVPIAGDLNWIVLWLQEFDDVVPTLDATIVVQPLGGGTENENTSFSTSGALGFFKNFAINPNKVAVDFYVGHLAVYRSPKGAGAIDRDERNDNGLGSSPFNAYITETADARFQRLCTEEGLANELIGTVGEGVAMGYQTSDTLVNLLRQCEASDDGIIYEMTSDFGLGYRTRRSLTNQSAALTLNHSSHELSAPLTPLVDDSFVANDVIATRVGGTSYNDVQITGPRSVQPPPAGMGRYDVSLDFSLATDVQAGYAASWARHKGTVAEARYKQVQVNLGSNELTGTVQRNNILATRPGDRVVITGVPARYGPSDISQLAVGFTETIDQFQHVVSINAVPESPYRTGVLGAAVKPRANTSGSYLRQSLNATDTSTQVLSPTGLAVWVDSATYASDFPFDVRVNGEVMTVTAITGTTNPQTLTLTRSVNGVVRSHDANSSVTLDVPGYVGM